jgi:hypothetical protein
MNRGRVPHNKGEIFFVIAVFRMNKQRGNNERKERLNKEQRFRILLG